MSSSTMIAERLTNLKQYTENAEQDRAEAPEIDPSATRWQSWEEAREQAQSSARWRGAVKALESALLPGEGPAWSTTD